MVDRRLPGLVDLHRRNKGLAHPPENGRVPRDMADQVATSAPAASSSTASTAASTTSSTTAAPASSSPASTSTPAAGAPASTATTTATQDNRSVEQIIADKLAAGPSLTGEPKEEAAVVEQTPATETVTTEGVDITEGEPADEETAGETDDTTTQETTGADEDDIDFGLDDEAIASAPTDPKALQAKLEAAPEVLAALEQHPELKNEIFANARIAAKVDKYEGIFSSPEEAQTAAGMSETLGGIRNLMIDLKPNDMDGTHGVIKGMLEAAALRDENGEVLRDANGNVKTDGTTGRFLANAFEFRLKILEAEAKAAGDEEALASIDTIMGRAKLRATSSPDQDDLSERERTLQQENQRLHTERQQQVQETQKAHDKAVESRTDRMLENSISKFVSRSTGLNDFNRSIVDANIRSGLVKAIQGNQRYQDELNLILRRPVGLAREKAEVALAAKWLQDKLPKIAREELTRAGASITASQKEKAEKHDARVEATKGESRAAIAPTKPNVTLSGAALQQQIVADFKAKNGREPSTQEYLAAKMNRSSAAA